MKPNEYKTAWCVVDGVVEEVLVYKIFFAGFTTMAMVLVPRLSKVSQVRVQSLCESRADAISVASRKLEADIAFYRSHVIEYHKRCENAWAEHEHWIKSGDYSAALGTVRVLLLQSQHVEDVLTKIFDLECKVKLLGAAENE